VVGDILQPTHLLLILVVALVVLGPKRLPEVGRSLGKGLRDFRSAISGMEEHTSGFMTDSIEQAEPAPTETAPDEVPTAVEPPLAAAATVTTTEQAEPAPSETTPDEAPAATQPSLAAAATATTHEPAENSD
jgi:sec-independent protein translocase protein TatA